MKCLALLGLGIMVLQAQQVQAHTYLAESVPADSAVLVEAPKEIVLTFSTDVRLTALTLQGSSGEPQKLGPVPEETEQRVLVAIEHNLVPGTYLLTWRAVGADTHVVSGEIHFSVLGSSSTLSNRVLPEP